MRGEISIFHLHFLISLFKPYYFNNVDMQPNQHKRKSMLKIYNTQQAAEKLGYTLGYVQLLAKKGKIETVQLGREYAFTDEGIELYRATRKPAGRPKTQNAVSS